MERQRLFREHEFGRKGNIDRERNKIRKSIINICNGIQSVGTKNNPIRKLDKLDKEKEHLQLKLDEILKLRHKKIDSFSRNVLFSRISRLQINLSDFNLLWIDDRPERSKNDRDFLQNLGFNIIVADSSEEASEYIESKKIDIILSDIKRNGKKEGLEFLTRLKDQGIKIPLIFYLEFFNEEKGVPPYAFGITNDPKELIHLLLDIIERSY